MKQRIIICGYPKSGNTWMTRLTAEIIGCPVAGYWCEPLNAEESIEGQDRVSDYRCFKAHHTHAQLEKTFTDYGNGTEKIVYIYRDPRDVVVSASHYFTPRPSRERLHGLLGAVPAGLRLYYKLYDSFEDRVDLFTRGLLEGTREGAWLKHPWKAHVEGFLARSGEVLMMSYEDLRKDPLRCARELCRFLALERTDAALEAAIHAQSFEQKKKALLQQGREDKAAFLRRGESGKWHQTLRAENLALLENDLGDLMRQLGYRLETR
jgi:hypothetical protein